MPDFDNLSEQKSFIILESYSSFTPSLYSAWDVNRVNKYTALKSAQLSSTLFCFVRTVSGSGRIVTTVGTFDVTENTLLLLRENTIIEYNSLNGVWQYNWYNFTTESPVPFFETDKIYNLVYTYEESQLKNEMFKAMQRYDEFNIKLASSCFLELIYRWIIVYRNEIENLSHHVTDIKEILTHINNNIEAPLPISELAGKCFLSERQFRLLFKKQTGLSPKKYICQQKLKKVAFLLKTTSRTVNEISVELNYSSPFHLSRDFKNQFGLSPKEYRQQKAF